MDEELRFVWVHMSWVHMHEHLSWEYSGWVPVQNLFYNIW